MQPNRFAYMPKIRLRRHILIMIDQVSRDAFSQLLTVRYLRRKGARVLICNQHTLIAMCERYRPAVVYASWLFGSPLMAYLVRYAKHAKLALIDQEGGRIGEAPFKRSFQRLGGMKAEAGRACAKVFSWGEAQAAWLRELRILPEERIAVTGSPRFDPYLVEQLRNSTPYLGVTLRGDALTSFRGRMMELIFEYAKSEESDGVSVGYPSGAQYEDKIWHVVATTRCLFRAAAKFAQRSKTPVVFRPGPWEQQQEYQFLTRLIPTASVQPNVLQHRYVRDAFALLEAASSMGLEGLLVGTPVISVHGLIPMLQERLSGAGGGISQAPYMKFYWQPATFEEAVELLLKAEKHQLPPMPANESAEDYFRECHGWPRSRPSSFEIGDELLALLDATPTSAQAAAAVPEFMPQDDVKLAVYRNFPGSVNFLKMKVIAQQWFSSDRQLWFRYHYYDWLYPHHQDVEATFQALWQRYEQKPKEVPNEVINQPCEILQ